ncbi:MAG TPA: Ig-like domain-containing protein, partial [Gemmatimonadales bacterium]|nr:Ig-like domain-containing protein [Gemmatimonadales bacterium]
MTFKHKLSRRLALLRNVVLLGAVCAAAACDLQQLLGLLNPVASVAVAPATASVAVGQTVSLAATPKDSTGRALVARIVTWASSAPAVATVDGSGMVTGVAAGTATVTATSEGQSGAAVVTVVAASAASVASVTLTPAAANVGVGQAVGLIATLKDANGNALIGRVVTWVSSVPAMATVNGSGLVTGVTAGAATVTASSEGRSGAAAITVTTPVVVTDPAKVTDLAVTGVTTSGLTLAFTEVDDGTGQPAKYDFRYAAGAIAFGSATDVAQGTCVRPVTGTAIGARQTCTILGLTAATGYQVQLV